MSQSKTLEIVADYCAKAPGQLQRLEELASQIRPDGPPPGAVAARAREEAHRMAGAAACMGFMAFSDALGRLEANLEALEQGTPWEQETLALRIVGDLRALAREVRYLQTNNSSLAAAPPKPRPDRRSPSVVEEEALLLRNQRVMVADDDAQVRSLVRNALLLAGVQEVTLAASGEEALRKLFNAKPTLIISDWSMEPLNGMQLLRCLREGRTSAPRDTFVVFLTKERQQQSVREAILAGADHFVVKPFSHESLLRAIRSVLRSGSNVEAMDAGRKDLAS